MKSKKIIMIIGIALVFTSSMSAFSSASQNGKDNMNEVVAGTAVATTTTSTVATATTSTVATGTKSNGDTIKDSDTKDFKFDEKTGTIEAYYGNDKVLKIPETINGVTVKAIVSTVHAPGIGEHQISFVDKGAPDIEEVIIPKTIKTIGEYSFLGCINLKKVVLNEGLRVIGSSAFYGCSLEEVTIPSTVVEIDDYAFSHNDKLSKVNMTNDLDVTNAFDYTAFKKQNESMNNGFFIVNNILVDYEGKDKILNIPEGVKAISLKASDIKLNNIEQINFPKSVEYIYTTFSDAAMLSKVTFADKCNLKYIKEDCFSKCNNLPEVNISSENFKGKYGITNNNQKLIINGKEITKEDKIKNDGSCDLKFIFDEKTGTITGYTGNDIDLIIPRSINGVQVKYIQATEESIKKGYGILGENSMVQSINIECNAEIKGNAFLNSQNLKSIKYSNDYNNSKVDPDAFKDCKKLSNAQNSTVTSEAYNGSPLSEFYTKAKTSDSNNVLLLIFALTSSTVVLFRNKLKMTIKNVFNL